MLEHDGACSGSFEPLRNLPDDKLAVLGLVSTKGDRLEPADDLLGRIEEASRYVSRDQLGHAVVALAAAADVDLGRRLRPSAMTRRTELSPWLGVCALVVEHAGPPSAPSPVRGSS
jgi:5-methyltetrahydropteroyltriglutamate--homocysteine methyltransferase